MSKNQSAQVRIPGPANHFLQELADVADRPKSICAADMVDLIRQCLASQKIGENAVQLVLPLWLTEAHRALQARTNDKSPTSG